MTNIDADKDGRSPPGPGSSPKAVEPASGLDASHSIPIAEKRPKSLTPDMAMRAAEKLAARLLAARLINGDAEGHARDIAKCGRQYMDGYQLAKELDSRCYWDCDLMLADELDAFSSLASTEIEAAEKAWAERNAVIPTLPINARVKIRSGETGVITEIYSHGVAKFCVAIDGDPQAVAPHNSRRIVNFEDAELAQGIEARQGGDAESGSVHESPTPTGDAPR